jgi:YegS/Rv2252/BmrU family lipid kinase
MAGERATIIFNPMSGRSGRGEHAAHSMQELLAARGINAELSPTAGPDDATALATQAVVSGMDLVICRGGDGTINEVVQALAGTEVRLAVWAGGTSNVVARDLQMPFDTESLANVIAAGKTTRVSLGRLSSPAGAAAGNDKLAARPGAADRRSVASPKAVSRYFLMMAGIGLDASIARGVNMKLKRQAGELAYWLSGLRHLLFWRPEHFTLEIDGRRFESAFAVIGKGKGYGGGLTLTPNASLAEPEFEVFIVPPLANNLSYLGVLMACMRGKPETTGASMLKARRVLANSSHSPWVEVDGEPIGPLPMEFEVVPDALSLIVPG